MSKTYSQTLDYLFSQLPMFQRVGPKAFKKDLTNIIALTETIGNPQNQFPSIHIAGTNGKGSTAHMIAAILQGRGLKVGLYTSPHYRDFRERIKINGTYISENQVIDFVTQYQLSFEKIKPSFFEISVAMAFEHFAKEKVEVAVIETGLGGRLDSTNIITPLASVITNISFDHTNFLGNTLPLIAGEKAGIIKKQIPVIIGETQQETQPVFFKKAVEMEAPITFADAHWQLLKNTITTSHTHFKISRNGQVCYQDLPLNLHGNFQKNNLITALESIHILDKAYPFLAPKENWNISIGLANLKQLTNFIGRWEIIGEQPTILCDSGHNEGGIQLIMKELQSLSFEKLHIVLGAVNDKNLDKVLGLFPLHAQYYFAKPNIPRGLNAITLQEQAAGFGLRGKVYTSVNEALESAKKAASTQDLIFVGGSTFVVAEVV